jgi:hypothetical protein
VTSNLPRVVAHIASAAGRARRTLAAAAAAAVLAAPVLPVHAGAQVPRAYTYTFRVSPDSGEATTGTVQVSGDRARIDMAEARGVGQSGDYLLLTDNGRTVTIVNPREREYSVTDAASFERIVATVMQALDLATIDAKLSDAHVSGARLGPGDTIAGHPTERYRLKQEYSVRVGAFGFKGDPEYHVVMTEYWVAPSLRLMRNPVIEMLSTTQTALAQQDRDFVRRSTAARDRLFSGTPLRIIVVAGTADEAGAVKPKSGARPRASTTTIEVSDVRSADVDHSRLEVPQGYREREGRLSWRYRL